MRFEAILQDLVGDRNHCNTLYSSFQSSWFCSISKQFVEFSTIKISLASLHRQLECQPDSLVQNYWNEARECVACFVIKMKCKFFSFNAFIFLDSGFSKPNEEKKIPNETETLECFFFFDSVNYTHFRCNERLFDAVFKHRHDPFVKCNNFRCVGASVLLAHAFSAVSEKKNAPTYCLLIVLQEFFFSVYESCAYALFPVLAFSFLLSRRITIKKSVSLPIQLPICERTKYKMWIAIVSIFVESPE